MMNIGGKEPNLLSLVVSCISLDFGMEVNGGVGTPGTRRVPLSDEVLLSPTGL